MAIASLVFTHKKQESNQIGFARLLQDKLFLAIILVGALVRILFVLIGAKIYYGENQMFINGDSYSYIMSFRNLLEHGTYTFDFLEPEAAFGRLPGYSFFYGLHYIVFGKQYAIQAVAWSQALLDCISIALVFMIAAKLTPKHQYPVPYVAAALYALYPFIIIWTTIIGTELLATFLTLVWLYTLLSNGQGWAYYVLLGLEIALLFYVREFMGVLLPITGLYILFMRQGAWPLALRNCMLLGLGFGMLYIWWPTRNYFYQHRIMLVKPERAGFANYKTDMTSFLNWVHSWSNESTYWLQQVLNNPHPDFPADIFASPQEREQAQMLVRQANKCGSSFYLYKHVRAIDYNDVQAMRENLDYTVECNEDIRRGFEQLRLSFKKQHPISYYIRVPLANLSKVFFKSRTQSNNGLTKSQLMLTIVFGYRALLLLLGVMGLVAYRNVPGIQIILIFWGFIVVFMCWYFRQLEMRYLLQADILLLLPAALIIGRGLTSCFNTKKLAIAVG